MTVDMELVLGEHPSNLVRVRLSKAPHILVAGMTGAGKSVLMHDLICQFIRGNTPQDAALVLVDPKRIEFGVYKGLPHLAIEPVYSLPDIEYALGWAAAEMHSRFATMERNGWRDVEEHGPWPRVLVVIDELANLMLGGKQFERPIIEIASMGRAAGVHLLLATQRPDATVINGLIRANVPTRVALPTITQAESRIILDQKGAETISIPERLIRLPGQRDLIKATGRYWKSEDIERTLSVWKKTGVWHG
jgi:S-DNA-T family DNA segregation ATPase FtsK/SpoIIIE